MRTIGISQNPFGKGEKEGSLAGLPSESSIRQIHRGMTSEDLLLQLLTRNPCNQDLCKFTGLLQLSGFEFERRSSNGGRTDFLE